MTMHKIEFSLDDEDYAKLEAFAKLTRRQPLPQAEVFVLEAIGSWPKKAPSKRADPAKTSGEQSMKWLATQVTGAQGA